MTSYRMYFVDNLRQCRWPCDLNAENDGEALVMAHALHYSCSDVPVGVELWQGARRIPGANIPNPTSLAANWDRASAARRETLLKMEQALQDSGMVMSKSRRLSERIDMLRRDADEKRTAPPLS